MMTYNVQYYVPTMTWHGLAKGQSCQWLSAAVDSGTFEDSVIHIEAFVQKRV
jgi:hypothetical protein